MKHELDKDNTVESKEEESKDKRGKKRSDKSKTKKTNFLIKRLKLKSKHSPSSSASQSEISIEPQPSTSSESSPAERQTPEGDDTDITLAKSASDTNLSESSWKSAENLTADKKKPVSKSVINVESSQVEIIISKQEQRTKSLEDLKDMPAFGEVIFDSNMSSTSPSAKPKDHLYKILVIGDLGTGKTSIIKRYVHQFFSQHYRATIGVDFALKVINWDANTLVRLQLWDIAGQERYGNMTRVYYKEAVGAFIVFDVTRANTFDSVTNWKADLDSKVQLPDGSSIPCVLLANKCDQPKEGIVTNSSKMDEYCKEKGFTAWYETSAKENINIDDAARALVTKILQNDVTANNDKSDQFTLSTEKVKQKKGCCF